MIVINSAAVLEITKGFGGKVKKRWVRSEQQEGTDTHTNKRKGSKMDEAEALREVGSGKREVGLVRAGGEGAGVGCESE